ncbi:hypothetical protein VNI00_018667 [Paramarasmius palmivorus]|uniref:Maturase K n=1 Tax=Paramarasmius palmivorus TaxID=297713 RepID=A0AAW0AV19_9AGAR
MDTSNPKNSFQTALPVELMEEILELYIEDENNRDVVNTLLVHPWMTSRLQRKLYRWIRVRRFVSLLSLHLAFANHKSLPSCVQGMDYRVPGDAVKAREVMIDEGIDERTDFGKLQGEVFAAIAPFVRHLVLKIGTVSPRLFFSIRTTSFPRLTFLQSSFHLVLDTNDTVASYKHLCQQDLLHVTSRRKNYLPTLKPLDVRYSWSALRRLHMQIDINEIIEDEPPSTKLKHFVSLRELSLSFLQSASYYYPDYLERMEISKSWKGLVIIMDDKWQTRTMVRAPYPASFYVVHPSLVFASRGTPYFFNTTSFPSPASVAHLKKRIKIYTISTTWDEIWEGAHCMIEVNQKETAREKWPSNALTVKEWM